MEHFIDIHHILLVGTFGISYIVTFPILLILDQLESC